jgi:DNA-directed RNA polymerase subunit RPC12/RpoP
MSDLKVKAYCTACHETMKADEADKDLECPYCGEKMLLIFIEGDIE